MFLFIFARFMKIDVCANRNYNFGDDLSSVLIPTENKKNLLTNVRILELGLFNSCLICILEGLLRN